jgi:hypothetical protein
MVMAEVLVTIKLMVGRERPLRKSGRGKVRCTKYGIDTKLWL